MSARTLSGKFLATALVVSALLLGGGDGRAAEEAKAPAGKASPLMTQDLSGIAGKEAVMLTVEYPPGGSSSAHRHNADVFVYVLEGSVVMQVEGAAPVTLRPGQTFYEGPDDVHLVGRNASGTEPAKFLAFFVKDKGAPVAVPVQ